MITKVKSHSRTTKGKKNSVVRSHARKYSKSVAKEYPTKGRNGFFEPVKKDLQSEIGYRGDTEQIRDIYGGKALTKNTKGRLKNAQRNIRKQKLG